MSAVGSNYISDGQIMAWLASQQDRIYGDLRASMDLAETRADFASELVEIKAHLEEANRNKDFGAVDQELQAFMTKYGSDPEFADICAALEPTATRIHNDWTYAQGDYNERHREYMDTSQAYAQAIEAGKTIQLPPAMQALVEKGEPTPPDPPVKSYSDDDIKTWTNLIDGQLDSSSKNDQLTMIHIQELKATLDQGVQMASSFIASGDKTTSAIINNLA
jgi:hypothetical protein